MPLVVSEPLQYPRKHPFPEVLKNSPVDDSIQKTTRDWSQPSLKVHRICPLPFMKIPIFDTFKKNIRALSSTVNKLCYVALSCWSWMKNNSFSVEGTSHSLRQATQVLSFNKIRRSKQCHNIKFRINWHLLRIYYIPGIFTCITSLTPPNNLVKKILLKPICRWEN